MSTYTAAETARKALQLAWNGALPVDPVAIAQGIVMYRDDPVTGRRIEMPIYVRPLSTHQLGGLSGRASMQQAPEICFFCDYNSDEISYRNRFTIAHELGHVLLGHVNEGKPMLRDSSFQNYDPPETAANTFAAELLMPEHKVRELFRSVRTIQELSEIFVVSNPAMTYRLKNLGLIN
ncbi:MULTISPECIES: ImmA/IrrE family metallo-endopeptidase [Pseudomonadaceae]|uniref:ImmA/IrrE family metallo-endopeptidase n=1 Tax=Pseudomonadaceae TaxID=135621 RepID=UPI00244B7288|nr:MULTISPECIES: ImmA/IrrE family metallo-endopeptidase [Pseudomonas]MDG9780899.1 ImmA/IrrE family metallo-endopeptidase [Pseudomonas otitidis]MDU9398218.1 ImmA/IrrE family metallo-endopeptidase [Pseudomonas sp. zfem003]